MAQTKSATEMKKATESKLLEKAQKEFYSVVNTFILPLCDPRGTLKLENRPEKNSSLVSFYYDQNKIEERSIMTCFESSHKIKFHVCAFSRVFQPIIMSRLFTWK